MLKNLFALSLLFAGAVLPALVNGQDQTSGNEPVSLSWRQTMLRTASGDKKALSFTGSATHPDGLPRYQTTFPGKVIVAFELVNPVYEALSSEESKLLPKGFSAAQPQVEIHTGTENKKPFSLVQLVPLRLNPATSLAEKLVSFSYRYEAGLPKPAASRQRQPAAATSVLNGANGAFYKLGVTGTGLYKIDFQALQALGIDPASIDPRQLQLYGNGGGMLPQLNSAARHDDLRQNAVLVAGEADGTFDQADYLLFYAQGPHKWRYNSTQQRETHQFNLYSDTAYYFLAVGASATSIRIGQSQALSPIGAPITTYNERQFYERDLVNMMAFVKSAASGRGWVGEQFNNFTTQLTPSPTFYLPGIVGGSDVKLQARLLNASCNSVTFNFTINGLNPGSITLSGRPCGAFSTYSAAATAQLYTSTANLNNLNYNGQNLSVQMSLGNSNSGPAFLDYIELLAERHLQLYGQQTTFRSYASLQNPVSTFTVSNFPSQAQIWNVTDPTRPRQLALTVNGSDATFTDSSATLQEYVVFEGSGFSKPVLGRKAIPQNLHEIGTSARPADLVIVTAPAFLAEANRLAAHRRSHDQLNVEVVTTHQVYNEFSSGAQDIVAIRDMMRMVYDRSQGNGRPLNLLLFGDGSYDYKYRIQGNTNFVPVYESEESLQPITTYSTEDFYGYLDDSEGLMSGIEFMDIGVGRLPVKSPEEAQIMVSKLISYVNRPATLDKWRNNVTFITDDEESSDPPFVDPAEKITAQLSIIDPQYNIRKMYLDSYAEIAVPSGQRSPDMVSDINKAVEQGSLVIDYVGHGGETGWASEHILEINQINAWNNLDRLAFFVTATCEFGRYDAPQRSSGAEYALMSPTGGAIGLLTTTRPVLSTTNDILNDKFVKCAFSPINGTMPTLGDILRITKNQSISGDYNRNYALLGDPSMKLAYPEHEIAITEINGIATGTLPDTLKALQKVTIKGIVTEKSTGALMQNFNGRLQATIYEKASSVDASSYLVSNRTIYTFRNVIYDGSATVTNGTWTLQFVVPKDISYAVGPGRLSFYAENGSIDASSANQSVLIGSSDPNGVTDNTPPQIELFMNDESFVFGGTTGSNPTLLAKLADDNGINTAGIGIGHEITGRLDEARDQVVILNDFYTAEKDSYQRGRVIYNQDALRNLSPGQHSIKVKAWDTSNNSNEAYLEFVVENEASLALGHVLNYPNPFSTNTVFHVDHNRAGDPLDVQVQVYTLSGRLVKTLAANFNGAASRSHLDGIQWDGRDDYGDVLAKGVYIYKVAVRSARDGAKAHKIEKLVILN